MKIYLYCANILIVFVLDVVYNNVSINFYKGNVMELETLNGVTREELLSRWDLTDENKPIW